MSLIFSTQINVPTNDGIVGKMLDQFGDAVGVPGLGTSVDRVSYGLKTPDLEALRNYAGGILARLAEQNFQKYDSSFMGTGTEPTVGGASSSPNSSTLDEANERSYYTQSPTFSVIIKNKMFSGFQDLNKPELLGPGETWLMRATKRLIARKCAIMADYERLTKLEKFDEFSSPNEVLQGLLTAVALGSNGQIGQAVSSTLNQMFEDADNVGAVDTLKELTKIAFDRRVPSVSTFYIDPDVPIIEALGVGTGVFEIATISSLNTSLDINEIGIGSGSCTFTIEDPYQILIVTEEDIEASLRDTAFSDFVASFNQVAAQLLLAAQNYDASLAEKRASRGVSPITFSVNLRGGQPLATIDSLNMEVTNDNLVDIPSEEMLDKQETDLFKSILRNLEAYNAALNLSALRGAANVNKQLEVDMRYARQKMRQFYLGKAIIQAMDSVHVYIDSGTRRYGEGEEAVNSDNIFSINQLVKSVAGSLGFEKPVDQLQMDENVVRQEYEKLKDTNTLTFETFRLMRGLDANGGSGTHVFGGIVSSVSDRYSAQDGKFILSVSCQPNIDWLKLSRYNTQPSMDQTEGIIYDPLTPFIIKTDEATHLPTGELDFTPENKARLESCGLYVNNGSNIGKKVHGFEDMPSDARPIGGNLIQLFDHVPGLLYRWKEGIMTATYNMQTIDPKSKNIVDKRQLRRDVGFFASNTPFDNMDAANVISTLVTGFPYNYTTFLQSAIQTGAFVFDTTLNKGKDFFHSFLDIRRTINRVQGNFIPFKLLTTSPQELANTLTQSIGAQQRLSNISSRLTQLRTEWARLDDRMKFLNGSKDGIGQGAGVTGILSELKIQQSNINNQIKALTAQFSTAANSAPTENNAVRIAGNDVLFDFENIQNKDDFQRFGDKLTYFLLRRREEVIYNKDKNYLVISDDYDKDYDIQAMVLKLREQSPNLWRSSWESAYEICVKAAEMLNFEFFTDTQGHVVFRPPQYNRVPLSVLEAMLLLQRTGGIQVFPDFLLSLFKKREESIITDVIALELEMKMNLALLGAKNSNEAHSVLNSYVAKDEFFISEINDVQRTISKNQAISPAEKYAIKLSIKNFNNLTNVSAAVSSEQSGIFNSIAQQNLQTSTIREFNKDTRRSRQTYYEENLGELVRLTGRQEKTFPEFEQAKVGAVRNGQSTPSTDVANIVTRLANLVSRRSSLLRILERVLDQNEQIGQTSEDGAVSLKSNNFSSGLWFGAEKELTGLTAKFIEDTRKDILGHLSADRFIIRDEHIFAQEFTESPPALTNVIVTGTDALVGEGGGNIAGGMPMYLAYGVDFDMWRQYGWRGEKSFDKPFFWDAELQCAPYAVMLLSRQRRDVVTGSITRIGNEFYQLGDVVYSTNRQLLYYVTGISHSISYDGRFETTLKLHYGHAPGDYIPTPLDIIGKSMTSRVGSQNSFRTRRLTPSTEAPIKAVLKFPTDKPNLGGLLSSQRNIDQLQNMATVFKSNIANDNSISPRLYVMTFTGSSKHDGQREAVKSWFQLPKKGVVSGKDTGADGLGGDSISSHSPGNASSFNIDAAHIFEKSIRQCEKVENLTSSELDLIRLGIVASDEAYRLSSDDASDTPDLSNIVEIRMVYPPSGGWSE